MPLGADGSKMATMRYVSLNELSIILKGLTYQDVTYWRRNFGKDRLLLGNLIDIFSGRGEEPLYLRIGAKNSGAQSCMGGPNSCLQDM
jgi:hypothetical protein